MISYEQMQDLENESQIDTHSCVNGIEESITRTFIWWFYLHIDTYLRKWHPEIHQ